MRYKAFYIIPILFLVMSNISCEENSIAQEFPECFTGTYLNIEGSGTQSLFTFTADGNFIGVSSAEKVLNFSTELGSWIATSSDTVKAVFLDFSFGNSGELVNIARVDLDITFIGDNCKETQGSFEIRFFEDNEDPLDISTDTGKAITDTFSGRKIVVE